MGVPETVPETSQFGFEKIIRYRTVRNRAAYANLPVAQ